MLLWHSAAALWLFRWIFRDPKVDVRYLLIGAILPDLIDLTLGTLVFPELATGELWFHAMTIVSVYMCVVLLTTRRGRRRRAFMALAVGWLFHLVLDGLWTTPEVLFWPFFGLDLPTGETPLWPMAWERAMSDPWRWVLEAVGLAYLVWLWFSAGLNQKQQRISLIRTGRIPEFVADDAVA